MPSGNHPAAQMACLAAYVKQHLIPDAAFANLDLIEKLKVFAGKDDLDLKSQH